MTEVRPAAASPPVAPAEQGAGAARLGVVLVGASGPPLLGYVAGPDGPWPLLSAASPDEALGRCRELARGALVVSGGLSAEQARDLVAASAAESEARGARIAHVVLCAGSRPEIFEALVSRDQLFYLASSPLGNRELWALVQAAVHHTVGADEAASDPVVAHAERESPAPPDLFAAIDGEQGRSCWSERCRRLVAAARAAVGADRARLLRYHGPSQTVTDLEEPPEGASHHSVAAGLVGWVVRTGLPARIDRAAEDPRYDRELDDPEGKGDERLAALAVAAGPGRVLGVLVATKEARRLAFTAAEIALLTAFAAELVSPLGRAEGEERSAHEAAGAGTLFRAEAVAEQRLGQRDLGRLLRRSSRWVTHGYRALCLLAVLALFAAAVVRVDRHVAGRAVVKVETAADGAVRVVLVALLAGQHLPDLRPGLALDFVMPGYPESRQRVAVGSVAGEVMGPARARASLGPALEELLVADGPVVIVTARLVGPSFVVGGRTVPYRTGMAGTVAVRTRSGSLLGALVPALRGVLGETDGR